MSKSGKKAQEPTKSRSLLRAAYGAWQQGDVAEARRLATAVVEGKRGPDDDHEALDLAKELTGEGPAVNGTPADVAKELLARSTTPGKAYAFAAMSAAVFVLLVTLALTRYAG